jgi:peptidyl-prolyl cis-trans isomerase C
MANCIRFLATTALVIGLAVPVWAQDAVPPTADTVVAIVNGTPITLGHMIVARETLPEQYKTLPPETLFTGILDQLIQQTTLEQSMAEKLSKSQTIQIENDRRAYVAGQALQGVVKAAITDDALQAAYKARIDVAGQTPKTEYNAAHILVETEEKALEIKAQLDGGADFAELAKANSTDTGSGANGGDLGWFGLGMMVPPFEAGVIAAEIGQVSAPIKTDFGFHLILVKETRVAAMPTLDEMRDELAAEIEGKTVEAHVKALTDAATIEKPGIGIDPLLLGDLTLLAK